MATCYRHPSRETGVACSNCGRPICPDCMTPTPVGMRCPECSRQRTKVKRMRDMATVPRVTYTLIAINVIAFFTEQGQFTIGGSTIHGTVINEGVLYRAGIARRPVLAPGLERLPAREPAAHRLQHVPAVSARQDARAGDRLAALRRIYFTSMLTGAFGVVFSTATPSLGASGAIFGLMGAAVVELRARGIGAMESGIGGLIVLNLILSFTLANISIGDHIGGLIGGALAGLAIRTADDRGVGWLGLLACLALSAAAVAGSIAVAGAGGTGFG